MRAAVKAASPVFDRGQHLVNTVSPETRRGGLSLERRIYRFALQCQHSEDALMDAPERLALDEVVEHFDAQCEFRDGEVPLGAGTALA
jgi:hypothetical protein